MLLRNLGYAARVLRRSPGFTASAVATLALGIGANTAIFSVLNAVLLRPLPFGQPDRLVWGWGKTTGVDIAGIAPAGFRDYRSGNRTFEHFAAMNVFVSHTALTGGEKPEQVTEGVVSANFFDALGLTPVIGRGFVPMDEQETLPQVVILGRSFWRQYFGGSASVIGKTVTLDGKLVTVVGVFPDTPLLLNAQMWVPTPMLNPGMNIRRSHFMRVIARLNPGVTIQQAQADLDAIAYRLGEQYPDSDKGWSVRLQPLNDVLLGSVKSVLVILLCAVTMVLLIACANVANLLLVRAAGREKELAIRAALGAGRKQMIAQLLTESSLLALAGGAGAVLLALWGVDALRRWGPANLPRLSEIRVDGTVLGFALLLSLATVLLFGLVPAWKSTRSSLQTPLKGSSVHLPSGHMKGGYLVIAELAISLVLLVSAGLMLKSLWKLVHVDPGFHTAHIATASFGFAQTTANQPERRNLFFQQLFEKVATMPGVESAGAVSELPMMGDENDGVFRLEGKIYPSGRGPGSYEVAIDHRVAGDYFQTMKIPLLKGRYISQRDSATSTPTVVVSEPFARHYFPGQDPIGKHLIVDQGDPVAREIVGVVGAVKFHGLEQSAFPEMYFPYSQYPYSSVNLVVRSSADAHDIGSALRAAVASIDPDQPISAIRSMDDVISASAAQPRFWSLLLGLFAAIAVLLSAVGLYGVISYAVSRQTREIGIRMALGASPGDVVRLVGSQGLRLTALGVGAGLMGSFFAARLLESYLFQVIPHDAGAFLFLPLALGAVALVACWIPARRAMNVDPAVSLREQ